MKLKILRLLTVCLMVFLSFSLAAPSSALAKQVRLGADSGLQVAVAETGQKATAPVEAQRKAASKLEIPTGSELGREQVKQVFEDADTRSAKETL
ncbi:MAG TPA: hypothetical protein V6D03_02655, partial [Candidatus Caenarcaniphilales bacterium]